mgnify:FL=1
MLNTNKRNTEIEDLLKHSYHHTKIKIYFSSRSVDDGFDPYEAKYTYTNLNPLTIKAYVRDIKEETLIWKQYGLTEVGAKEVITEEKYAEYFRLANKVEIDNDVYQVYREAVGNRVLITKRPFKLYRIILRKMR